MDRLIKWIELPIRGLLWLGLVAGFLMMVHVTVDVFGRTVFKQPLRGTTEIVAAYYMVAVAYSAWAWLSLTDSHLSAQFFTGMMSARVTFWREIAVKTLTAAFVATFTWQTCLRALRATRSNESWEAATGYLAIWPSRWLLPLAGGVMVAYLVLRILSDVAAAARRQKPQ